ncbi:cytochrome P450 [Streptomyces sp. URMC 125]|uniref:cytochrome P450 n=1 Tax=Streptomyces sp. URMC 125 TaxID=3423419 RepID=UPI003F199513
MKLPYGEPVWMATRHADVRSFLLDQRFSRKAALGKDAPGFSPGGYAHTIPFMDAPEHTEARRMVARALTKKRIDSLRPRIESIAEDLIDGMVAQGSSADLVTSLAKPFPVAVNCEMYAVPEADREQFHAWSSALLVTAGLPPQKFMENFTGLMGYTAELVAQRRKEPGDDLISALVAQWDAQDRFTEDDLCKAVISLLLGGHDPVTAHIANSVYVLLCRPEKYRRLCEQPDIVPTAVEELLRFVSIGDIFGFGSYATEDVEIGGRTIRRGEPMLALLASANRDAEVFEDPDTLDLTREHNPHVAFGHGPHYCAGTALARVELQTVFAALTRRLPTLRLGPGDQKAWWHGMVTVIRTLKTLPVEW